MAKKDDFYITMLKFMRRKAIAGEPAERPETLAHVQGIHPQISPEAIGLAFYLAFGAFLVSSMIGVTSIIIAVNS